MNWRIWNRAGGAGCDGCTAIEPLLSLYSDRMASPAEARRIEAHLKDCAGCRQSLDWMRATRQVIAARPAVPPPTDLRARIARAIAEAEGGVPPPVLRALPARRPMTLRPALAYGLSFALLAALSGSLFWNNSHPTVSAVHPAPHPVAVAVNPARTQGPAVRVVPPRLHHASPLVASNKVEPSGPDGISRYVLVPHLPSVRTHLRPSQPDDVRTFTDAVLNGTDTAAPKRSPALKPRPSVKASVTAHAHHAAPQVNPPPADNEHLAVKPKPDTTAPPKRSPLTPPPVEVATAHVPADVTPETPRINILPATITPEVRPEVREASLTDTLRESVRHMHETALTSHSFKLSSSVVEAADVSSDRSGTLAAVASGFGGH